MTFDRMLSLGLVVTMTSLGGCSLLVDSSNVQCHTDSDCVSYGGHPSCQDHVCAPSGLGPEGCVITKPTSQSDYFNACTSAQNVSFDNCHRLGMCDTPGAMPSTIDPTNATIPPLVNPATVPIQPCAEAGPNLIYMYGTSDFAPLLRAVQPLLSANTPKYRAIYQNATSCGGVASVFDSTKRLMKDPAPGSSSYAFYFDDNGTQTTCLLTPGGNTIDIGVSNLFSATCNTDTATFVSGLGVNDYRGPVVPFVLSVPATSTETVISAEAAHMVFGRGGRANGDGSLMDAMPWTNPTYYFIRNSGAGSTVLTSLVIGVPKAKFWGVDRLSTDNLRDSMLASTATNQSIGILSIDYADKNRGNLRSLYLQASGQSSGYLPDSNKNSFDKLNVRDGHYPLWGYVHFFTPVGAGGVPSDAAKTLVTRFSVARLDQMLLDNIIGASLVPQCAMKVQRQGEIADYNEQSGLQCGCYFDWKTKGSNSCTPCSSPSDCPSDKNACNYGYCEAS